ncbi:MAG: O-antigen ligase family protein [Planctomycetaceae bacterium]
MTHRASQAIADPFHSRPMFWLTLAVVFGAFFLADHDLSVSQSDAFTGTADEMEQQAAGGNALRRASFLAIAGLGVLGLLLPAYAERGQRGTTGSGSDDGHRRAEPFAIHNPRTAIRPGVLALLIAALAGWCLLSVLWSDMPSMSLRRCIVAGCLLVGAVGIARQLSLRELVHLAWIIPAVWLAIGVSAEIRLGTFRPWSGEYRFSGTTHPNTQGLSLATMCFATFCLAREGRWKKRGYLVVCGIGLLFLVLTKSRTSFAGVLGALTLLLTMRTASGTKWSVGLFAVWSVATAALFVLLFNVDVGEQLTHLALMGRKEQSASLTGRMPIWTVLADFVSQRPIVGYGYESFWTPDRIDAVSTELQWGIREAHSAYIDTVLSVGLVGAGLLLLTVFTGLRSAAQRYLKTGHPSFGFLFAVCVFGLINAFTESGMTMPMFVPFVAVCGFVQLARLRPANAGPLFNLEMAHTSLLDGPAR